METLMLYLIGLCATASLLMAWFFTTGPVHIFHILRRLGWRKKDTTLWSEITPEWESTWVHLELMMAHPSFPAMLSTLLQCRYCFSFHVSFWVSLACAILAGQGVLFVLGATFSWPILANLLLLPFNNNNHN